MRGVSYLLEILEMVSAQLKHNISSFLTIVLEERGTSFTLNIGDAIGL